MSRCTIAFHIHYHIRYYEYTLLSQQGVYVMMVVAGS